MESLMTSLLTLVNVIIVVVVPFVCSASLEYSINEELPVGTIVAEIRNDAVWLRRKHSPEVFDSLRFAILQSGSVTTSYFAIDDVSGQIRITERIDREAVCPDKPMTSCVLRVDFGVRPANHFEIIRSEFTIMDVNDNAPSFETGSSFELTISETSPVGSTFDIPSATDIDSGENGNVDYKLRDETKEQNFRLVVSRSRKSGTNADDVKLQQVRALDRERRSKYRLTLVASDRGHVTKLVETLIINVAVSDVNDNAPRFERQSYEIAVPEDAPIGMTVVRMQATDEDSGDNAQIRYRFSTRTQSIYGDTFAIDPTTGDVVLLQSLAYGSDDPVTTYQLSVVAEDSGPFPTPAHASLVVKVIDVNDHSPRISIDTSSTNGEHSSNSYAQPEVAEHSPAGTFVGHVTVTDADSGSNGVVHCELAPGSPDKRQADFQLVYVYEGEYQLLTAREFDREISGLHFAAIRCADGGTPARLTTRNITVIITDTNDNVPTFSKDVYEVTVPENSPWGTVVTRLSASDLDLGDNGHITYLLDRRDKAKLASGRRFHVDPDTGVITTLVGLDRERTDVIEFNVLATDAGKQANGRQVALATVRVHVSDVDDESPKFIDSEHALSVDENLPVGTRVGRVAAVDLDAPPYNAFSYRLRSVDVEPDAALFHIDAGTGVISTAAVFDREIRPSYRLSVLAQSDTVRARSDVSSVTVRVVDTNDNRPTFIFPNDVNDTALVAISSILAASASGGHVIVATCEATDADEGVNSQLSYDIIDDDGTHPGLFRIDKVSGRLTMMTNSLTLMDRNGNISQSLMIRASDDGSPSLSTVQTLHVVIVEGGDVINYDYADWMKSLASNSDRSDNNTRWLERVLAWLSGGGFIIVGACLASVATVVVILAVALCVVRIKRRRRASCALPLTKVELQPLSPSGTTASHPLLDDDDKLCDHDVIRLKEFDNEPVRYVTAPFSGGGGRLLLLNDVRVTSEHDTDSGCADVSNSDDCGSSHGSNSSAEACNGKFETKINRPPGGATLSIDLTRRPAATLNRSNLTADRERMMTSSTLGNRKTVRFADDSPCPSGSTARPVSGEYLRVAASDTGDRSGSPSRLTPPRLGVPNQQLTSFISVGDSTGSAV